MNRPRGFIALVVLCLAVLESRASDRELSPQEAYRLVDDLFSGERAVRDRAKKQLIAAGDRSIAPALVEVIFFSRYGKDDANDILESLLGERVDRNEKGKGYKGWLEAIGRHTEIVPMPGYLEFKAKQYGRIDPAFAEFLDPSHPRTIRPEEIVFGGPVKDGIPALLNPRVIPASHAHLLHDDEIVFGVSINAEQRAYPKRIMVRHEMANDVVGGRPIALSYCTLCGSPVLYDTTLGEGETYTFGSSGLLHRSNKLMYDHQTNTLWSQLDGAPVMGSLVGKGKTLRVLPLTFTTWGDWRSRHPETTVLSLEQGFDRDYSPGAAYADYFASPDLMFPVWIRSDALQAKDIVWVVYAGGWEKAYPVDILRSRVLLLDEVGEVPVVHLAEPGGGAIRTFESGGRTLEWRGADLVDARTGEAFSITEEALVSVSDSEVKLPRLPSHESYWFGWFATNPDGEVYRGEE